jgi:hypothetical protein
MPTLNNYTISDAVFSVVEGSNIYDTQQTATLVISPNTGYTVDADDFYRSGAMPNFVDDYEFVQVGNNVHLVLTLVDGFTMPSNNIIGEFCIGGSGVPLLYQVKTGAEYVVTGNASWDYTDQSFYEFGEYGTTINVLTNTVTADAGSKLVSTNFIFDFPNESFTYTEDKVFNIDGDWISSTFNIFYTFPAYNWLDGNGDELYTSPYYIKVEAVAEEIYVELPIITAYTISNYSIPSTEFIINMVVYGNPGALFSIELFDPVSSSVIAADVELEGYSYAIQIPFPEVSANTEYVIEISGDLSESFDTPTGQPSEIIINQYIPITVTLDATTSNDLEGFSTITRSNTANSIPIQNSYSSSASFIWEIVDTYNADLEITNEYNNFYWSNIETYFKSVVGNFTSSSTIDVDSTTNILPGMILVNSSGFSNIRIDSIVDSNTILLDSSVTVVDEQGLEFSSDENTKIDINASLVLSEDNKKAILTADVTFIQYGGADITFELDLDQLISKVPDTGNTTGLISATFDNADACSLTLTEDIWFQGTTRVFTDAAYTIPFEGGNNRWKVRRDDNLIAFSAEIDDDGYIVGPGFICDEPI